jgi:predicted membrane protein
MDLVSLFLGVMVKSYIYLAYALGLVLTAALAIPNVGLIPTFWFIVYLLGGIFMLHSPEYRMYYFLGNIVISVLFFIVSLKVLSVLIGLVASTGFLLSVLSLGRKKTVKKEAIRKIIDEVVSGRKKEEMKKPQVLVYETAKPKKKTAKKSRKQ